jgi:hypothetical protein
MVSPAYSSNDSGLRKKHNPKKGDKAPHPNHWSEREIITACPSNS